MLHKCSTMKTATVRELRNHYSGLMKWIEAGEEIRITRRGKPIARLVPEPAEHASTVDWSQSSTVQRKRCKEDQISAEAARNLLEDSSGEW